MFLFAGEWCHDSWAKMRQLLSWVSAMLLSCLLLLSSVSAQQENLLSAEQRIETTTQLVFSNHNVNLNNVGLDDDQHPTDLGPKLVGPNVCTKQEA